MFDKVLKKLNEEFAEYKLLLESSPPKTIIEKSYETSTKQELIYAFMGSKLIGEDSLILLNSLERPLDYLYQEWLDTDVSVLNTLELSIKDSLDKLVRYAATEKETMEL